MRTLALLAALLLAEWAPVLFCLSLLGLLVWLMPGWFWLVSLGATAVLFVGGYLLRRHRDNQGDVSD